MNWLSDYFETFIVNFVKPEKHAPFRTYVNQKISDGKFDLYL